MPSATEPTTRHFNVRQASLSDFKALLEFYRRHATAALPAPTAKTVGDTIKQGRILLVEEQATSAIVASGAVFDLSPSAALTYVGELAGMRATRAVGGLRPLTMQFVLIGLRLLGLVATELQGLKKGVTNSIITIVKESNTASIRNIEATGMKPLQQRPEWFRYDEFVWHGHVVDTEWKYYYADAETVVEVLRQLSAVGLFEGELKLSRTEKGTNQPESCVFHLQLKDISRAEKDLRAILDDKAGPGVDLVAPPDDLVF